MRKGSLTCFLFLLLLIDLNIEGSIPCSGHGTSQLKGIPDTFIGVLISNIFPS